jgi:predicted dithiol-disulfide oxidoreductase (DUF899 family)
MIKEPTTPNIVSKEEWIAARKEFLVREKEFTKERDALSAARRELPWMKMDKPYVFEGAQGKVGFGDLFKGLSQLIVYHFMLTPGEMVGCSGCSFWADNFDGIDVHLAHRDTSFVAVSRAPYEEIVQFKERMGWKFDWYSSYESDFNYDLDVAWREGDKVFYNFEEKDWFEPDMQGVSAFLKNEEGIFRTYSTYLRGIDILNSAYNYLDLTAKGRHEEGLEHSMAWLRRHDEYTG